jgi:hypothetical protein
LLALSPLIMLAIYQIFGLDGAVTDSGWTK